MVRLMARASNWLEFRLFRFNRRLASTGDLGAEDVAALFGTTKGYKASDPNVTPAGQAGDEEVVDDFGCLFVPGLEERVADLLVELNVKYEYESTKIPYQIQYNYTPDFLLPNGVYLECKGYKDAADRRKIKAVKQLHPDLDLRMVFQSPFNTISKKSKTTYAKYCEKLGIPWTSFTNIPLEWLV